MRLWAAPAMSVAAATDSVRRHRAEIDFRRSRVRRRC